MNLHEEIAKVAYELYKKSGCINGKDVENWVEAEKIVLTRHASQDIEEPEGEEPIVAEQEFIEEIEGSPSIHGKQNKEDLTTVVEEIEVKSPAVGTKEDIDMRTEKIRPAMKSAAKSRKEVPGKASPKSKKKRPPESSSGIKK